MVLTWYSQNIPTSTTKELMSLWNLNQVFVNIDPKCLWSGMSILRLLPKWKNVSQIVSETCVSKLFLSCSPQDICDIILTFGLGGTKPLCKTSDSLSLAMYCGMIINAIIMKCGCFHLEKSAVEVIVWCLNCSQLDLVTNMLSHCSWVMHICISISGHQIYKTKQERHFVNAFLPSLI